MSCIDPHCPNSGLITPYDRQPLGLAAEMYVNYQGEITKDGEVWPRALRDWNIVRQEAENPESQFLCRISPFQKQLVLLLREWWTSATEDNRNIVERLKEFMETTDQEPIPQYIQRDMSHYCFMLFNLFVSEFVDLTPVTFQRRKTQDEAGWIAACRRAATKTAYRFCQVLAAKGEAESRLSAGSNSSDQVRIVFDADDGPTLQVSPNAILEACPWLPDHNKHGLPYFLWDLEAKKNGPLWRPRQASRLRHCQPYLGEMESLGPG